MDVFWREAVRGQNTQTDNQALASQEPSEAPQWPCMTLFCIFLNLIDKVYFSSYFFTVNSLLYCVCVLFALFAAVFRSFFGYAILKCSSKALAMYPSISVTLSIIGQIMQSWRTDAHTDTDTQKHIHTQAHMQMHSETNTHTCTERQKHTHSDAFSSVFFIQLPKRCHC